MTRRIIFKCDEHVRNRTTGETGRVVGPCDSFGLVPVIYDEPPSGVYHVSEHRLEPLDEQRVRAVVERELRTTIEMQRKVA